MQKQIEQAVEEYTFRKTRPARIFNQNDRADGNLRGGASFIGTNRTRADRYVGQGIEKSEC